eukprot:6675470-Pyramimonas_sp.AAC.1
MCIRDSLDLCGLLGGQLVLLGRVDWARCCRCLASCWRGGRLVDEADPWWGGARVRDEHAAGGRH